MKTLLEVLGGAAGGFVFARYYYGDLISVGKKALSYVQQNLSAEKISLENWLKGK